MHIFFALFAYYDGKESRGQARKEENFTECVMYSSTYKYNVYYINFYTQLILISLHYFMHTTTIISHGHINIKWSCKPIMQYA